MGDVAIRIEGLGKKYLIGGKQKQNNRLGDQVVDMVLSPFQRTGRLLAGKPTLPLNWIRSFGR